MERPRESEPREREKIQLQLPRESVETAKTEDDRAIAITVDASFPPPPAADTAKLSESDAAAPVSPYVVAAAAAAAAEVTESGGNGEHFDLYFHPDTKTKKKVHFDLVRPDTYYKIIPRDGETDKFPKVHVNYSLGGPKKIIRITANRCDPLTDADDHEKDEDDSSLKTEIHKVIECDCRVKKTGRFEGQVEIDVTDLIPKFRDKARAIGVRVTIEPPIEMAKTVTNILQKNLDDHFDELRRSLRGHLPRSEFEEVSGAENLHSLREYELIGKDIREVLEEDGK